ncbi:zinc/manganese transport system substrate-binding protein [Enterobacter sp. BIGb0383]|uniref:zinc ABC transporter substrate-binding protein AztC n=1 Tax=unclassified Enterobacter TaxID=2608935 RepID=UPI000F48EE3E|nr:MULTISPECIES: zinc ABC transporter substrate-binding protein AztC [unclassified Enterobacter]ROP61773.1 zinc/manganese transport system substrate-binding protein [Enterobacter sp. BIGb0383]ROS11934.1 zinc/manganese transport system substrate-binding protein [Enterobacter sp. BIGb0359]
MNLSRYVAAVTVIAALLPWPLQAKIKVVASFSILGDIASNIGQQNIALRTVVGPDSDAHVYEPSPADAIAMAKADLILINGLQFEGFINRLVEASESKAPVIEVTKGANIIQDPAGGHYHFNNGKAVFHAAPFDPHAWQSVSNVKVYVNNITAAFCAVDKSGCAQYQENARTYSQALERLDSRIKNAVQSLPADQRTVVVGHNAFHYFERDYGLHFLSPQGISTESEASAADVAGILREIKKNSARAVFAENISNPRLVEQIADEAGMKVSGVLYSDALSGPSGPAATYITMMQHNAATLISALGGNYQ